MKETFIIIGEGPTEYFFLTSLKDEFRTLQNIDPQYPKHTSVAELELKIKNAIDQGYNHVYCMIDLDNKKEVRIRATISILKRNITASIFRNQRKVLTAVLNSLKQRDAPSCSSFTTSSTPPNCTITRTKSRQTSARNVAI